MLRDMVEASEMDKPGRHSGQPLAAGGQAPAGDAGLAAVAVSVVVPVRDEAESIPGLIEEIERGLHALGPFEIIYVDDGSIDRTAAVLAAAKSRHARLRCLAHDGPCGQSAAIRTGVLAAGGELIVTLDGDGQNDPADIRRLLEALLDPGAPRALAMVAGRRGRRQDRAPKRLASLVANAIRRAVLGDGMQDTGCGLKAFRRDAFLLLPYFDHMHRFLPALMQREGFQVREVEVGHRPRRHGRTKYGVLDRAVVGAVDLLGMLWLRSRRRRQPNAKEW